MIALQDISDKWITVENVKLKLYPLFINQDGSIVYEEHDHYATNFKYHIQQILRFYNHPKSVLRTIEDELRSHLEGVLRNAKLFKNPSDIRIPHIWEYLRGGIPYTEDYQATEEIKDILNAIVIARKNLYLRIKELFECTNNCLELRNSILEILNSGIDLDSFLIMFFGFDKKFSCLHKMIITSEPNIYERFWNYILEGYSIEQIPRIINDNGKLYVVNQRQSIEDKECEEELRLIKKEAKPNEYHLFMK